MRIRRMLALSAVSAVALVVVPVTTAHAASVGCGDTITANVTLTTDLRCTGTAFTLGVGGLTIDLGGHTLSGSGVGFGVHGGPYSVTVKNGTIRNFQVGIDPGGYGPVPPARVPSYVSDVTIRETDYGVGGYLGGGTNRVEIARSTFHGVRTAAVSVHSAQVTGSTFIENRWGIYAMAGQSVSSSVFTRNDQAIVCGNSGVDIANSTFVDNRESVRAGVCSVAIRDSKFRGGAVAVTAGGVSGFGLDVRRNTFSGGGIGLLVTGLNPSTSASHTIADNVFRDNAASGLVVERAASALPSGGLVTVARNTFEANGKAPSGYVDPAGHPLSSGVWVNGGTLAANAAVRNAGHGIEAYNAVDGGGNTAKANRTEPQCIGVVCTR